MNCERKHKRTKYEAKRPGGSCGGEMVDVTSEDGSRVYGKQCAICGATWAKCEHCGRLFANLGKHVEKTPECGADNRMHRTMVAVKNIGKNIP